MKFVAKKLQETADASRGKSTKGDWVKTIVGVSATLIVAYFVIGFLGSVIGSRIPDAWERNIAPDITTIFPKATLSVEKEEAYQQRIDAVLAKLKEGEELRDLPYEALIVEAGMANAFASPGGSIGITPELLELVESEVGLAFVIAHEIGHHEHRHVTKKLGRGIALSLAAGLVSEGYARNTIGSMMNTAELHYSREMEEEADEYAIELIKRKYSSTEGATEFFEDILKEEASSMKLPHYFHTHPDTAKRIQFVREKFSEDS